MNKKFIFLSLLVISSSAIFASERSYVTVVHASSYDVVSNGSDRGFCDERLNHEDCPNLGDEEVLDVASVGSCGHQKSNHIHQKVVENLSFVKPSNESVKSVNSQSDVHGGSLFVTSKSGLMTNFSAQSSEQNSSSSMMSVCLSVNALAAHDFILGVDQDSFIASKNRINGFVPEGQKIGKGKKAIAVVVASAAHQESIKE